MKKMSSLEIGRLIDSVALKPTLTYAEIETICAQAIANNFAIVSAASSYIPMVAKLLAGSSVRTGASIGFPLGNSSTAAKVAETLQAIKDGADEIDMVAQIGALRSGDYDFYRQDIAEVVKAAKGKAIVKVIVETCYLTQEEKAKACALVIETGADFIKTSTGFGPAGAQLADVELFSRIAGGRIQIKASGGIKTLRQLESFVEAGATRIGTSSGSEIVAEARDEEAKGLR